MKTTNQNNSSMKNLFNIVIVAFVAMALTFGTTSCKKEEVNPSTPSSGNTAPTVSASFAGNTITVVATDVDGSISKVEILDGSTVVTTLTSSPYTFSVASLSAGTYTYTVKAYDNANAVSTTTVTFTISGGGTGNHAPTFSSTSLKVVSDGTAKVVDLSSLVNDADGNTISIVSISPMTNVSNVSGTSFTVTPSNSIFAGSLSYTVVITDGTDNTSSTVTVNVGETAQIATYNTLNSFFGNLPNSDIGNCTLNKGTITTTMTQPSAGFFNSATSAGTYNYTILASGNIEFVVGANHIEYSVSSASSVLTLTKVSNGDVYNLF